MIEVEALRDDFVAEEGEDADVIIMEVDGVTTLTSTSQTFAQLFADIPHPVH